MQHVDIQLRPSQQTIHSQRAAQYNDAIKQKRDGESAEPPDGPGDDAKGQSAASNTQSSPSDLPVLDARGAARKSKSAAHKPKRAARKSRRALRVPEEILDLLPGWDPTDYVTEATSEDGAVGGTKKSVDGTTKADGGTKKRSAWKTTHFDVLFEVMRVCQLKGDNDRAARAWGMIMRTRMRGRPFDLREDERWVIGANLLQNSRHHSSSNQYTPGQSYYDSPIHGLELARDYYERLILQYPYRKMRPNAVDCRIFYPPLFNVWFRSVFEKAKRAREELETKLQRARTANVSSEGATTAEDARAQEEAINERESASAREICERLDQLVLSPPFDKDADILLYRVLVGVWLSKLILYTPQSPRQDDNSNGDMRMSDDRHSTAESTAEKQRKSTDSSAEKQRAEEFFKSAATNSGDAEAFRQRHTNVLNGDLAEEIAKLGG